MAAPDPNNAVRRVLFNVSPLLVQPSKRHDLLGTFVLVVVVSSQKCKIIVLQRFRMVKYP
jgi:hypothetical protein